MNDPRHQKDPQTRSDQTSWQNNPPKVSGDGASLPPSTSESSSGAEQLSLPPGQVREEPIVQLARCCLMDLVDGNLVKKVQAPYDPNSELLDVSGLAELFNRLDTLRIIGLGGAVTTEFYPPAWAASLKDIDLTFGAVEDPFTTCPFGEFCALDPDAGGVPDLLDYAVKVQRVVKSLAELQSYIEYQESYGLISPEPADVVTAKNFLVQTVERSRARTTESS